MCTHMHINKAEHIHTSEQHTKLFTLFTIIKGCVLKFIQTKGMIWSSLLHWRTHWARLKVVCNSWGSVVVMTPNEFSAVPLGLLRFSAQLISGEWVEGLSIFGLRSLSRSGIAVFLSSHCKGLNSAPRGTSSRECFDAWRSQPKENRLSPSQEHSKK